MADVELPELPHDFDGYPYKVQRDAFRRAQALLGITSISCTLGNTVLEEALILQTCLCLRHDEAKQAQLDTLLSQLGRKSGRTRPNIPKPYP